MSPPFLDQRKPHTNIASLPAPNCYFCFFSRCHSIIWLKACPTAGTQPYWIAARAASAKMRVIATRFIFFVVGPDLTQTHARATMEKVITLTAFPAVAFHTDRNFRNPESRQTQSHIHPEPCCRPSFAR